MEDSWRITVSISRLLSCVNCPRGILSVCSTNNKLSISYSVEFCSLIFALDLDWTAFSPPTEETAADKAVQWGELLARGTGAVNDAEGNGLIHRFRSENEGANAAADEAALE